MLKLNVKDTVKNLRATRVLGALLYIVLMALAMQALLNPTPYTVKGFGLFLGLVFLIILKQEHMVYVATFSLFFAYQLRYFHTISNFVICTMVIMLLIKSAIEKRNVLEKGRVFRNPFFLPSLSILLAYALSVIGPLSEGSEDLHFHFDFLGSLCCIMAYSYILIAFVTNKRRLVNIGIILLIILVMNLGFGMITLFDPNFTFVPGYLQSSSIIGSGAHREFRLGGLNFAWEAYAEYLMMTIVFISGFIMNFKMSPRKRIIGVILLLLSVFELLLSNTRGAIVVMCFGLLILVFVTQRLSLVQKVTLAATAGILFAGSLYAAHLTGYLEVGQRFSTFSGMSDSRYGPIPTDRAEAWIPAMNKIIEDRFLGSGPSLYPFTTYHNRQSTDLLWPHNIILLILATIGIYGLMAYLFLFVRFLFLYKGIRRIHDDFSRWFFYLLGLSLMMFTIDALKFDGFLRTADSYFYFIWLLISLVFCSRNFTEAKNHA